MSKTHSLAGRTVVITGASSGVGHAAALAFARCGAHLVLAARRQDKLEAVAAHCHRLGARAEVVPTDVGRASEMQALADRALARFGGIDVWINNAGVGAVGGFTETPIDAHERVIRTNLLGYLHGAHAVLPHFRQRRRGVLINTLSVGSWAPAPYSVAYSASKFGLRGFSEALRGELSRFPAIHVCDVFPAFLDTPGISHAGNYTGRQISPVPPLVDPRRVADAMVRLAISPRPAVTVGAAARAIRLGHWMAPGLGAWLMARGMELYLPRARKARLSSGNLFEAPVEPGRIDGQYGHRSGTLRQVSPWLAALAVVGLGAWAMTRR